MNASPTGTKATLADGLSPSPGPGRWLSRWWPRRAQRTPSRRPAHRLDAGQPAHARRRDRHCRAGSMPRPVPLTGRVIPLASRDLPLRDALVAGGQAIGAVPVEAADRPQAGTPSSSPAAPIPMRRSGQAPDMPPVTAGGSGLRASAAADGAISSLPFGHMPPHHSPPPRYSCVPAFQPAPTMPPRLSAGTAGASTHPQSSTRCSCRVAGPGHVRTALAGAGAVGAVWMHAIWATTGVRGNVLVADADKAGVTNSNLNRCPLFGITSLGQPKAAEAARICRDATVTWDPRKARFEDLGPIPGILISASTPTGRARPSKAGIRRGSCQPAPAICARRHSEPGRPATARAYALQPARAAPRR